MEESASTAWQFGILGPVAASYRGATVRIKGVKPRAVLGMLLLAPNHVVGVDALIDGLWGDEPPATAAAALQVHVAKLRQTLAAAAKTQSDAAPIDTEPPGYVVRVEADALDLARFEELVRRGRAEAERGKPSECSALLRRALELWRGPALADLAGEPFALAAVPRLEEARFAALGDRIDADLARGAPAEVVGELRELAASNPLRERFWEQLMVALYRCGRQADALAAFQTARSVLLDELGIGPGARLRELEVAVLDQSPALDWTPPDAGRAADGGVASTAFGDEAAMRRARLEIGTTHVDIVGRATIGRHPANVVVLDDTKVSRDHAAIRATADGFVINDLRSTNGTFVNGARVDEQPLADGDVILVGSTEMTLRVED